MNLIETLHLLYAKEKTNGALLQSALAIKRHRQLSNLPILDASNAYYLPATNTKARTKWGRVFIEGIFKFFNIADNNRGPQEPVFFVTLADKAHLTTEDQQKIKLRSIKRKLGSGLMGLNYIGMIEPGYYANIYKSDEKQKNVVSWHAHFIVWGITESQLAQHLDGIKSRFEPIMPGLCAVHKKSIPPDQFGYKLWYMIKSPCKEYSIGRRRKPHQKTGAVRYKQNSRDIRPGNRVRLFNLLRDIYLDELAMAGGNGRKLLATIKYEALREFHTKNGWDDKRP
ncbi:MAG: hypothetical protein WAL80_21670 [Xanthobacteraceae bacterium]